MKDSVYADMEDSEKQVASAVSDYECAKNTKVEYVAVLTGPRKTRSKEYSKFSCELPDFLRKTLT